MNKYAEHSRRSQSARRRRRMCLDKAAFETPEEARQKGNDFYQCRHCGKYHRTGQLATLLAIARRHGKS